MSEQKIVMQAPQLARQESKQRIAARLPGKNRVFLPESASFETTRSSAADASTWLSMIYNLLLDLDELSGMLHYALQHEFWMNAYLLSAGMNQVLEDFLHPDPFFLGRIAKQLGDFPHPAGKLVVKTIDTASRFVAFLDNGRKSKQRILGFQIKLSKYVGELAELVMGGHHPDRNTIAWLVAEGESLIESAGGLPASVRSEVMRIPSCFRSFDQLPEDLVKVIQKFSAQWPDLQREIAVIGVRTSGSYLAPLYAAILKTCGYQNVSVFTIRPYRAINPREMQALRQLGRRNGLVLLCDDPPISGSSIEKTAHLLQRVGLSSQNIILLLQLFGEEQDLPARLQKYPSVLMPWSDWTIHSFLDSTRVAQVLSSIWSPDFLVSDVERLPSTDKGYLRQHTQAKYRIKLISRSNHQEVEKLVLVRGVGLGYLGEHTLAVASRLSTVTPKFIAYQDGLLYEEILPPTQRFSFQELEEKKWIDLLAHYIFMRNQVLPVPEDIGLKLNNRNAVWEVSSDLLSKVFKRGWFLARLPFIDPFVKEVLRAPHPSVIDGDMALRHWYKRPDTNSPLMKMNLDERDFSHSDLYSYDPIYDVACLAAEIDPESPSTKLRRSYEAISHRKISAERWMLYQLVHLWDLRRQDGENSLIYRRRMAQALQRYFSEIYFNDLNASSDGPRCAIDIDGVLETTFLDFSSLTPNGAMSLHALARHGYRVILATGRSLAEVKERCEAYALPGGVAEYGAVIYDHLTGLALPLVTASEQGLLDKLRHQLMDIEGIHLDPNYCYSVRAFRKGKDGRTQGLLPEMIDRILQEAELGSQVYAIPGKAQTDFMVNRINKGVGLKNWLSRFDPDSQCQTENFGKKKPFAMAIGDGFADLPMLELADLAFAPANAAPEVKHKPIHVTARPYQRGLSQAVTELLGHKPGECPLCQLGHLPSDTMKMQAILAVQENDGPGIAWQALKLAIRKG